MFASMSSLVRPRGALLLAFSLAACSNNLGVILPTPIIDTAKSMLVADRTTGLLANGIDAATFSVRLVDPNSITLAGATVQATVTGARVTVTPAPVMPAADGGATLT